jgi:hypothetical protein
MKITIFVLWALFSVIPLKAQLFSDKKLYPGTKSIIVKEFNGAGGPGYWHIRSLDDKGRTIQKDFFRHQKLLSRFSFAYNDMDDEIQSVEFFSINDPERKDTTSTTYRYNERNDIVYQCLKFGSEDSITYLLESILPDRTYRYIRIGPSPRSTEYSIYEFHTVIRNAEGHVIRHLIENPAEGTRQTREFVYFENGLLKKETVKRIPEPETPPVYVGGPGADEVYFEYKLDKKGRLITIYTVIGGVKRKVTTSKYL